MQLPPRPLRVALATTLLSIVAVATAFVPSAASAATTTPVAAPGSCLHPLHPDTLKPVAYRFATRSNIWRARISFGSVAATTLPGAGKSAGSMGAVTIHTGRAASYLVLDARQVKDQCYFLLRMPAVGTTTNYKAGWVNRDLLVTTRSLWQIEVDRSDFRVRVYKAGRKVLDEQVVIGRPAYPTPLAPATKPFAMYDAVAGKATDFTGTWELATTAHNEVDSTLGRVGIHGRGGESLNDALGTASSHGCIRTDNSTVNRIVTMIGLPNLFGVPVVITQ